MPLPASLYSNDAAALKERLYKAEAESSLDAPDMKPWHLLATFQLFDEKGKATETGTIEVWWAGPNLHKTVYTSPSYSNAELTLERGFYKSKPLYTPFILQQAYLSILHPILSDSKLAESYLRNEERN